MATVRANCPDCGDVEFTTLDIAVRITAPDGSGTYAFVCPGCVETVVRAAERRTIDLLLSSGCRIATSEVPLEFLEPKCSRPLTKDDIESFAGKLYDGMNLKQAFEALVREVNSE
jgi:predicted RNA-binding Zn-ribbon protein involved in translation (DUF1610 family)